MFKAITQFKGLKKEIYIFFIGKLVTALGSFVWPMLTFFMTTKLGYSDSFSALILAIATFSSIPATFLGGKIADKFSKKKIIIIFDTIGISFFFLAGILPFGAITIVLIFMAAVSQSVEGPSYEALISEFSTTKDREKACTLEYLGNNLGIIAGSALSGLLFVNYTRMAIMLNGVAILVSTVLIALYVDMRHAIKEQEVIETPESVYEEPIDRKTSVLKVFKDRFIILVISLVLLFAWLLPNMNGTLLPLKLKSLHGEDGATIYGYITSFNGFVVIACTPILSMLFKKLHEIPKMVFGTLFYTIGLAIFMITNNSYVMFAAMLVFTIGEILLVIGSSPYLSRRIPLSHRGRASGIISVAQTFSMALIELLLSRMLAWTNSNYFVCYLVFVIIGAVAVLIGSFSYRKDKKTFPILYKDGN